MLDAERNQIFADKKKEIINELLGEESPYPVVEDVTVKTVDKNWGTNKTCYDSQRVLPGKSFNEMVEIEKMNSMLRQNNGVIYTKSESPILEEAPVIK